MTYEQAEEQQLISNNALGENLETVKFGIFAFWLYNWQKNYQLVLYPTKYATPFGNADYSQAIAFARVSNVAQFKMPSGGSYDEFVDAFDADVAADEELNNYLNP